MAAHHDRVGGTLLSVPGGKSLVSEGLRKTGRRVGRRTWGQTDKEREPATVRSQ